LGLKFPDITPDKIEIFNPHPALQIFGFVFRRIGIVLFGRAIEHAWFGIEQLAAEGIEDVSDIQVAGAIFVTAIDIGDKRQKMVVEQATRRIDLVRLGIDRVGEGADVLHATGQCASNARE